MEDTYLGIDVGTGSVRVGAFDSQGYLKGIGKHDMPAGDLRREKIFDLLPVHINDGLYIFDELRNAFGNNLTGCRDVGGCAHVRSEIR